MRLEVNVTSDLEVQLFVNDQHKKCFSDGRYVFNDLPENTTVKIKQIELQRKWYLFPLYILEGLFTMLLCCFSEYSAADFLRPYLHEYTFKINLQPDSKISVKSTSSNAKGDQGNLEVCGDNIYDVAHDIKFNASSFVSVLVKTYFTCLSGPLLLIAFLLFLLLATSFSSAIGIVVVALVSGIVLILSWIKIGIEKQKIQQAKAIFLDKKTIS